MNVAVEVVVLQGFTEYVLGLEAGLSQFESRGHSPFHGVLY